MVTLYKISIPKLKFDTIPEDERIFYLLGAHVLNELNTLNKILVMCNDYEDKPGIGAAGTTQSLIIIRILVGKIYETWLLIKEKYLGNLENTYTAKFSADDGTESVAAKKAFDEIKAYFENNLDENKRHILQKIRNNFSFHYEDERKVIANAYHDIPSTEPLELYLADNVGNSLYFLSEVIVSHAMLEAVQAGNKQGAMDKLVEETGQVIGWFNEFIGGYIAIVTTHYLGTTLEALDAKSIEVDGVNLSTVKIPYFVA